MTPAQMFSTIGNDEKSRFHVGDKVNTPCGMATMKGQFMRGLRWWCETTEGTFTAETINRLNMENKNSAEIKTRNYKYCTIINRHSETFTAKVEYSETSEAWEPTHVMIDGNWLSIDFFENTEEGDSYACEDYRTVF